MGKVEEAREFLKMVGMPKAQQADICCYVLLAMADMKPDMSWKEASNGWIRIHDIIQFSNTFYGTTYAENSRETFRKQALHRFRTAALVEDNGKATNSPNYRYRLTEEMCIRDRLKATQLTDLELAYAPPYSSAKDPVNMAGFMIDNIAKGTLKQWHLEDMDKISKDKSAVLLDVRTVGEFNRGHINGFKNIPVDELRERINEVEKEKLVYLICQSGLRSYIASRILEGNGYETYNFSGGFRFYDAVINDRALIERAYACGMDYYSNPLK